MAELGQLLQLQEALSLELEVAVQEDFLERVQAEQAAEETEPPEALEQLVLQIQAEAAEQLAGVR
jgi:hypothetical protein